MKLMNIAISTAFALLCSYTSPVQGQAPIKSALPTDTAHVLPADTLKKYEVRIARAGIIVVDSGMHTRAFEPFGGTYAGAKAYAEMVNEYKRAFGDSVSVYCMTIPNAVAYYCPKSHIARTGDEKATIDKLYSCLSNSIISIQIYDILNSRKEEPIYSRTDHHWAPLGAFYAAEEFARKASVRFKPLSAYETRYVHDFVGSMYTFSKDIAVKKAPEEFVYYVPKGVNYTTWFTSYTLGKGRRVIGESEPTERNFFITYKDGSAGAYCTFMGGDTRTVKVRTENKNGRRLMILKDSYGNALPAYLFYGFEEIHVVDFRYFPHSIRQYVKDNDITDVLFANNLIHACSAATTRKYLEMLARQDNDNAINHTTK